MDRRSAISALGGGLLAALSPLVRSQALSSRTLRFIVGYPAGGVADFIARMTTEGLPEGRDDSDLERHFCASDHAGRGLE